MGWSLHSSLWACANNVTLKTVSNGVLAWANSSLTIRRKLRARPSRRPSWKAVLSITGLFNKARINHAAVRIAFLFLPDFLGSGVFRDSALRALQICVPRHSERPGRTGKKDQG